MAATSNLNGDLPSLKPNERAGRCQPYTGSVCREHLGTNYIFVSQGLTQDYIEQKLQASLQVISNSPELSKECAKYAIPAICLSTLPLCDTQTQKPRKVGNIGNDFEFQYHCTLLSVTLEFTSPLFTVEIEKKIKIWFQLLFFQ